EMTELEMVRDQLKDEYEILEELGRGGMAIVFKAREKQLERDVAIKVLPFSLAFDKEFVERFQREARTSAKLEHPGIIPIYRVGKSGRVIYFVMKFLRGKPSPPSSRRAARCRRERSDKCSSRSRAPSPTRTRAASYIATSSPTTSCSTSTPRRS